MEVLVFDTSPLSHFARAGWLGVLKSLVGSRRALIPAQVAAELQQAVGYEHTVGAVLDATWIEHHELCTNEELRAFASFAAHLMSDGRNEGETAVLAVAATMPNAQAVLDDAAAYKAAQRAGVSCTRTLGLLCDAVREGLLTAVIVSNIADDLIETNYRLPFGPGEFNAWATEEGVFLPDQGSSPTDGGP